jgi:hypothetical protein
MAPAKPGVGKHPEESEILFGQRDRKDKGKKLLQVCNFKVKPFVTQQTARL